MDTCYYGHLIIMDSLLCPWEKKVEMIVNIKECTEKI